MRFERKQERVLVTVSARLWDEYVMAKRQDRYHNDDALVGDLEQASEADLVEACQGLERPGE